MKQTLVLATVLAALAAFWLFVRDTGDGRADRGAAVAESPAPEREAAGNAVLEPDRRGPELADTASAAAGREAAADELQGAELRVEVLDDESGAPVAGAELWIVDRGSVALEELRAFTERQVSPLETFQRFGARKLTDSAGRARVAWSGQEVSVLAAEGERMAIASLAPGAEPELSIRLPRGSAVVARVVRDDKPVAGVPVALHVRGGDDLQLDLLVEESSAPDGLVRFAGFRDLIRFPDGREPTFYLRLAYPGSGRPARRFRADDPPEKPIELAMRDTAPIDVRLVDSAGAPVDVAAMVTLSASGTETGRSPELRVALQAGVARFPFVGTSVVLDAVVEAPASGSRWTGTLSERRTPNELGVLVVEAIERPTISGRLRAADGPSVLSGPSSWYLSIRDEAGRDRQRPFQPRADGAFRADVDEALKPGDLVTASVLRFDAGSWGGRADAAGPIRLGPRDNPLGDLVVREIQGRIAGRCLDLDGKPVFGLPVRVALDLGADGFVDETDAEGRFEARGVFPELADVTVESEDWVLVAPVRAVPGDEDVVVRVAHGGSIRATLAPGQAFAPNELSMVVYDEALVNPGGTDYSAWTSFDVGGIAVATGLATGSYRCKILHGAQTLLVVDGVASALGRETVDPRLQELDVSGLLRTVALTVVDASGARIARAHASVLDGERQQGGDNEHDGVIKLELGPTADLRVLVQAQGFRYALLEHVDGDRRVVLARGIPVRLSSSVHPELSLGKRTASLSFQPLDLPPPLQPEHVLVSVPDALAAKGEALVEFPGPGRYRLSIAITTPVGGGRSMISGSTPRDDAPVVEIREEDANGTVTFDLPESVFER